MPAKDALIVLSGGMDSVTLLHDCAQSIALAVNFIYGSNHNLRELECARLHCRQLGIELIEMNLGFIGDNFHSSLLDGAEDPSAPADCPPPPQDLPKAVDSKL